MKIRCAEKARYWRSATLLLNRVFIQKGVRHLNWCTKPCLSFLCAIILLISSQSNSAQTKNDLSKKTKDSQSFQSITRSTSSDHINITVQNKKTLANNTSNAVISKQKQQEGLLRIYRSNLLKRTYQHIVYPESAIDKNHEGDVVLKVVIDRKGNIKKIDFDSRANFNSLNKAASRAIKKARPFPPVPMRLEGESFEVTMPIKFRLTS